MGDKEFEDFLNNQDGKEIPECQKRLLFDILQQKLGNSTDLIDTVSKLYLKNPKKDYEEWLDDLLIISKEAFQQLDYLMSVLLDEINGELE